MFRSALLATLGLASLATAPVWADPLPIHTATARQPRAISTEQRMAVAEAVAEVVRAAAPDVLTAAETRSRIETLDPAGLACDAPTCCPTISTPLHARGVVLIRQQEMRHHRLRLWVGVVNLRGEVTVQNEAEESVGDRVEAIALARLVARPIADALRPAPAQPPPREVLTPPVVPPPAALPNVPVAPPPRVPLPPPTMRVETYRRPGLAVFGGTLMAVGLTGMTMGTVSIARSGSVARSLPNEGVNEVYVSRTRDYLFLGVGAAATAAGVYFLVDGLRQRQRTVRIAGFSITGSSVSLTVEGRF